MIPISNTLRARVVAEAPHLRQMVREAAVVEDADVVDAGALPAIAPPPATNVTGPPQSVSAGPVPILGPTPGPTPGPTLWPTLWQHVPVDDPDAFLDGQLRATVVTLLARQNPLDRPTIGAALRSHLDVEGDLADALAGEVRTALDTDPTLLDELRAATANDASATMTPVQRATVVKPQRPARGTTANAGTGLEDAVEDAVENAAEDRVENAAEDGALDDKNKKPGGPRG